MGVTSLSCPLIGPKSFCLAMTLVMGKAPDLKFLREEGKLSPEPAGSHDFQLKVIYIPGAHLGVTWSDLVQTPGDPS